MYSNSSLFAVPWLSKCSPSSLFTVEKKLSITVVAASAAAHAARDAVGLEHILVIFAGVLRSESVSNLCLIGGCLPYCGGFSIRMATTVQLAGREHD